jgi:PhnB protein
MKVRLDPYLSFKDNAREAMEFYKSVFGGKLDIQTFKDFGMPTKDAASGDLVMHSMIEADNGITFMAADTPPEMGEFKEGARISMTLNGSDEKQLTEYWEKLGEDGKVTMTLEKAPWGDKFGMLEDKFGIHWMVDIGEPRRPQ